MSLNIIIRGKNRFGKSRPEQESNLRKSGYVGMTDDHLDRAKFIEKKTGWKGFIPQTEIKDLSDRLE